MAPANNFGERGKPIFFLGEFKWQPNSLLGRGGGIVGHRQYGGFLICATLI